MCELIIAPGHVTQGRNDSLGWKLRSFVLLPRQLFFLFCFGTSAPRPGGGKRGHRSGPGETAQRGARTRQRANKDPSDHQASQATKQPFVLTERLVR